MRKAFEDVYAYELGAYEDVYAYELWRGWGRYGRLYPEVLRYTLSEPE